MRYTQKEIDRQAEERKQKREEEKVARDKEREERKKRKQAAAQAAAVRKAEKVEAQKRALDSDARLREALEEVERTDDCLKGAKAILSDADFDGFLTTARAEVEKRKRDLAKAEAYLADLEARRHMAYEGGDELENRRQEALQRLGEARREHEEAWRGVSMSFRKQKRDRALRRAVKPYLKNLDDAGGS